MIVPVGEMVAVVVEIHLKCQSDLLEVREADYLLPLLLRPGQRRQQQRRQNCDDSDNHQQFDQRKTGLFPEMDWLACLHCCRTR